MSLVVFLCLVPELILMFGLGHKEPERRRMNFFIWSQCWFAVLTLCFVALWTISGQQPTFPLRPFCWLALANCGLALIGMAVHAAGEFRKTIKLASSR